MFAAQRVIWCCYENMLVLPPAFAAHTLVARCLANPTNHQVDAVLEGAVIDSVTFEPQP